MAKSMTELSQTMSVRSAEKSSCVSLTSLDLQDLYETLAVGADRDKIRILDLHPGSPDTALKVTLRLADLSASPHYEALSYTWGCSTSTQTLCVNDYYDFQITENLYQALRGLRMRDQKRTMWVDAICINQSDGSEKGHQVANMGRIFKNATCVNIWLGQSKTRIMPIDLQALLNPRTLVKLLKARTREEKETIWAVIRNFGGRTRSALERTEYPWHSRVWVVQEYALARTIYLCFGTHRWLFSDHLKRVLLYRFLSASSEIRVLLYNIQRKMEPVKQALENGHGTIDIYNAVIALAGAHATDDRDFIYGLSAFLSDEDIRILEPDYNSPVWEVFAKATYLSILTRKNFDVLALSQADYKRSRQGLPTWAVDFAKLGYDSQEFPAKSARKQTSKLPRLQGFVELDPSHKYLTVLGIPFGYVTKSVDFLGPSRFIERILDLVSTAAIDSASCTSGTNTSGAIAWLLKHHQDQRGCDAMDMNDWKTGLRERTGNNSYPLPFSDWAALEMLFKQHPHRPLGHSGPPKEPIKPPSEIFVTDNGILGCTFNKLLRSKLKSGDQLIVVDDSFLCFILRPAGEYYELVGIACIAQQVSEDLWADLMEAGFESEVQKFTLC